MEDLQDFLKGKKYKKIKFTILKTQHLLIKASINTVKGTFILDTGASNSCVGLEGIEKFQLFAENSETKAAGAGAIGMDTQLSKNNKLQLSRWKTSDFNLIIFNMSHVNEALRLYKTKPVDGIIGADILLNGKAIIDYSNHYLYLL
ncbi:acid protease [Flavobacterium sp. 316]|uniref:Retroviral-like aspartic protease family protein n=1 Tax=Flavobacterium sediminilitoris TaxID=2024526 RepID=A0ABY4HQQ5_9FLAO|nr:MULTISPECIES: retropepsin-like aspartic protease [Flavobacterium]KIX21070.1 acid protease [Flavobacterium sp. 316]UOX35204.1 retroviral-like aspartic protease family protein [Flavobacterium sediminilitoris]